MNEKQIVKELKKGNLKVFPHFIDLFKNRIFSMVYKFTNDYFEAQDLAQDIFLKIYKEIEGFRFESKLSTWVFRVATNTCIDWKRKKDKIKTLTFTDMTSDNKSNISEQIRSEEELTDDQVLAIEEQQEIHEMIYGLSDIYKTVIIMYHFNNMPYSEIASVLDIPEKTIETRLYRARKKLRDELTKKDVGGGGNWTVRRC